MKQVMVDLETLSTNVDAAILSIGVMEFELETGSIGASGSWTIEPQSCINHGLRIDGSTILWWMGREDEARNEILLAHKFPLASALLQLKRFLAEDAQTIQPWAHGAGFDLPILRNAYKAIGRAVPWRYYNERDTRTIIDLAEQMGGVEILNSTPPAEHRALGDCRRQIQMVHEAYRVLKGL